MTTSTEYCQRANPQIENLIVRLAPQLLMVIVSCVKLQMNLKAIKNEKLSRFTYNYNT